jgi:multidrug efflux pump subunit AcrA (membrane-fusion protein)
MNRFKRFLSTDMFRPVPKGKDNVFSFKDISSVEVAVQVPERIVARTSFSTVGQVEVSFDADRAQHYPARTKEFSPQSNLVTRTHQLVVDVTAPETLNLFPGMTVVL